MRQSSWSIVLEHAEILFMPPRRLAQVNTSFKSAQALPATLFYYVNDKTKLLFSAGEN
jgi:hypothetical protein